MITDVYQQKSPAGANGFRTRSGAFINGLFLLGTQRLADHRDNLQSKPFRVLLLDALYVRGVGPELRFGHLLRDIHRVGPGVEVPHDRIEGGDAAVTGYACSLSDDGPVKRSTGPEGNAEPL